MKRYFKFVAVLLLVVSISLITSGCDKKREELTFKGEDGTIVFNLHADQEYKISTDKKDFRTSREQGALIGKDFKIGIEFDDDYDYFFKSDFNELKKKRKDNKNYKEVKYSDMDGIQYFYAGYNNYEVIFPINDKYLLVLTIYGKEDTEKAAEEAINNEEVIDVLNHITSVETSK